MRVKTLVTGGAGFVGSHVVRGLLARGDTVVVLDDFSAGKPENLPAHERLTVVRGDVARMDDVRTAMQGCGNVIHLAALVSVPLSIELPQKTYESNVLGFHHVLEAARQTGVAGSFIYASSAAVYGVDSSGTVKEHDALGATLSNPYAASKVENEVISAAYAVGYGMRTCGLRFFNIYGPGQDAKSPYSGVLARVVDCARSGETLKIFGDGKQTRDFVAVGDVVKVILGIIDLPKGAPVPPVMNLGSGKAVSILDMVERVSAVEGVTIALEHHAARAGDIRHSCADIALLRRTLPAWEPVGLDAGLRAWLRG